MFYSVEEFHRVLEKSIQKVHGIRDNMFPVELVLEVAVSLLTENYRDPFKNLLNKATEYLIKDIITMLDDTLKPYPHFKVSMYVVELKWYIKIFMIRI